jgi:hypothetical protein
MHRPWHLRRVAVESPPLRQPRGIEADEPFYIIERHRTGKPNHESLRDNRQGAQSQQRQGNRAKPPELTILRQALSFRAFHTLKLQKPTRLFMDPVRPVLALYRSRMGQSALQRAAQNLPAVQFIAAHGRVPVSPMSASRTNSEPETRHFPFAPTSTSSQTRVIGHCQNAACFFDCLIFYDFSSSER